jgi:phenylalanyl-tRNA synthetase beta chain
VLGYIHEVKPHPDADRLVLAMVDHGTGGIEQIVTGAPNLHPYRGQKLSPPIPVPIAREGAEVYDGHSEIPGKRMTLKEKAIRGIPNRHMVCSELELGLSDEHEGVLLLDYEDYKQYAPGTPLQAVLGDVILHVDFTPNLSRCMSILGVAREVAALFDLPLHEPDYTLPYTDGGDIHQKLAIEIQEPDLNPRFTAALLQNVRLGPSPQWMHRRLQMIGQRPINNIVDISNYVMFELGQPTHAFDYDLLQTRAGGNKPTLITRLPQAGEKLTTLDGQEHQLQGHNLLVADQAGPLSFAGIMGGQESEVQPDTQNVLLEAAAWNLISIRKTLSSTKISTEAAGRFSRGVHPAMAWRGLARAARLMIDLAGAKLLPGVLDVYPRPAEELVLDFPLSEVARILGFPIPAEEVVGILRRLGFGVDPQGDTLRVSVPDHRLDIGAGVVGWADLLEDIARIYGYNRIPNTQIRDEIPPQRNNLPLEREELTRDLLAQMGLQEVINYRLTTPEREGLLVPDGAPSAWDWRDYVALANPISADKTVMRQTLLAGLLEMAERNSYQRKRQALFEVGAVYLSQPGHKLPAEPLRLGIFMAGPRALATWQGGESGAMLDFYDLKGVVEGLLAGLHITGASFAAAEHSSFRPGRVASLMIGGQNLGYLGEIHPLVTESFGIEVNLERPLLGAELDLEALLALASLSHPVRAIPTTPAVYQDISFVLDRAIPAAQIEAVIWKAGKDLLAAVDLFDVYTGEQIPADKKSMAYALTYQSLDSTLTDGQVAKVHKAIVGAVEHQLGAKLRG